LKALDASALAWIYLGVAGLLEVGFTTALTLAHKGKAWAWVLFCACVIGSFAALEEATKTIPLGIGYAVWTAIGAAGTVLVSAWVFKAAITPVQYGFLALLITSVIGLKLAGSH